MSSAKKHPALDLSAFQQVAVKQDDPVAVVRARSIPTLPEPLPEKSEALERAESTRPVPVPDTKPEAATAQSGKTLRHQKPSRAGRVQIMGWFSSETRLALKRLALDNGKTLEEVMAEAFSQYLERQPKQ